MPIDRRRTILRLAWPIIGGMTSQNILNLIDIAMVGRLGAPALAGVGLAGFLNFMAVGAITGLAAGVQATSARRVGEGRHGESAVPLNNGLIMAVAAGLPLSVGLWWLAPWIVDALLEDPAVTAEGSVYWQGRLLGVIAIGANFCFRGFWSGVGHTKIYLRTLVTTHLLNVPISYCLIFGKLGLPEMGVLGAGLGTSIAVWIGTAIYATVAWRHAQDRGFLHARGRPGDFGRLIRLALPNSLQQALFAAGFSVLFWMIGQVGTPELAVSTVLINVMLVAILPAIGFGLAAGTLAGQALGRSESDDAHRWAWDVVRLGCLWLAAIGLPMLFIPRVLLGTFLDEASLVELGKIPLQLFGVGLIIDGAGIILMQALLGVGASRSVMFVAVGLQWLLFLPVVYVLGPVLHYGLVAIWLAMFVWRGLQTGLFVWLWQRGDWRELRV